MHRIITLLLLISGTLLLSAQNYPNIVNYSINTTPVNGAKIKTNIPLPLGGRMIKLKIEGYAYGEASVINLDIVFYTYESTFVNMSAASSGGISPDIWLANENGKVIIFLDMKVYYQRFTVSAFGLEAPEDFSGWTVSDEALSGTYRVKVPYSSDIINTTLRIGKIGEIGDKNVPIGDITARYNIDFTGYRDVAKDQIGARISAIRFNKHIAGNALVQNTGLGFYTNPSGSNAGEQDLVEAMRITPHGNIGIGIANPKNKFEVAGTIRAKEVKIEATGWSDFVFESDYRLPCLTEVEKHIKENKHLPDVPSEKEVLENGVNVVEMQAKLLQKIEELTLYVIELDKENKELKSQVKELQIQQSKDN